jgi:hypothetical protein
MMMMMYAACEHAHTVYPSHPHTNAVVVNIGAEILVLERRGLLVGYGGRA